MTDENATNFPVVTEGDVGAGPVQTVDGRDLHAFLGIATAFKDWIARRTAEYGFLEGADFCSFLSETGGRPSKEYALTLDTAKELAMVERNEQGRLVRQYFIDCERRAKATVDPVRALSDPATMRGLLLTYSEKVLALEAENAEMKPAVAALDRIATAQGSLCRTDAAKTLQVRPNDLIGYLRSHGWTYRRAGTSVDLAYQTKLVQGLLEHKVETITRPDGTEKVTVQVRVTPKGLSVLAKLMPPPAIAA